MIKRILSTTFALVFSFSICQAQTADEIVNSYLKAIGGKQKLSNMKSLRMLALVKAQEMEMPAEILKKYPNMTKMTLSFQGYEIVQPAFDGEKGWATNFMTMQNEEMDEDGSAAMKQEAQDFPDPFYRYSEKGYKIAREEDVEENGKLFFAIRFDKHSVIINGEEISNSSVYLIDKTTFLPYKRSSMADVGPTKGMSIETIFSNYKAVEGIRFPYLVEQRVNGVAQFSMTVEMIEMNPPIEDISFKFSN